MNNKKNAIKGAVVLFAICLVVAAALAVVNHFTVTKIERDNNERKRASLMVALSGSEDFEDITATLVPGSETVTAVYKETTGKGYVLLLVTKSRYSKENMGITVGVAPDGKISGIVLTSYGETKDFGKSNYPDSYIGKDSSLSGIDTVSGVTYSSTAFRDAIKDAFETLDTNGLLGKGGAN